LVGSWYAPGGRLDAFVPKPHSLGAAVFCIIASTYTRARPGRARCSVPARAGLCSLCPRFFVGAGSARAWPSRTPSGVRVRFVSRALGPACLAPGPASGRWPGAAALAPGPASGRWPGAEPRRSRLAPGPASGRWPGAAALAPGPASGRWPGAELRRSRLAPDPASGRWPGATALAPGPASGRWPGAELRRSRLAPDPASGRWPGATALAPGPASGRWPGAELRPGAASGPPRASSGAQVWAVCPARGAFVLGVACSRGRRECPRGGGSGLGARRPPGGWLS
jgi:hypothetical protein